MYQDIKFYDRPPIVESNGHYDYGRIAKALSLSCEVFSSRRLAETYSRYANDFVDGLPPDTIAGAFGTGFPFYLLSPHLPERYHIPEFSRFLGMTQRKLDTHVDTHPNSGWVCPHCQDERQLPDLKTICKPCDRVTFKPRDAFKAIPDVDITLVASPTRANLAAIDAYAQAINLGVSDVDIDGSIDRFVDGLKQGNPSQFILVDIHVLDPATYANALSRAKAGCTDIQTPILSYRGNNNWVEGEELPFWHDLVIAMTPLGSPLLEGNKALADTMTSLQPTIYSVLPNLGAAFQGKKEERMLAEPTSAQLIQASVAHRFGLPMDFISASAIR